MTQSTSQKCLSIATLKQKTVARLASIKSRIKSDSKSLVNIKYKFGGNVYKNIQSLKSDIEEYLISCATHLRSIVGDSMRKRIDA